MVIALVRRIDTRHFIGFFAAPDIPALAQLVQEADHPTECEFAEIPSGGFICGNPFSYDVRIPLQEKADRQTKPFDAEWPHSFEVFDAAEPTEGLAIAMSNPDLNWRPMTEALTEYRQELKRSLPAA
ncbi:hypothetical protein K3720_13655 [Leisingera caerulea]|uniref:hypothetical protein n=1 Tax=Leisingera caerulea TaxID=506591 RepID=UPI0021A3BC0B|nr:hypothetical protein [Leisingera caerulea]UWQ48959.1 hypothetical protein K3720_13655 [Leisingera caerulea]